MSNIEWIWNKSVELCAWSTGDFNGRGVSCGDSTKQNLFSNYWQPRIVTSISCSDQWDCNGCGQQHFHALQIQRLGNFFPRSVRIQVSAKPPHAAAPFAGHEPAARPTASCSSGELLGSAHLMGGGPWLAAAVVASTQHGEMAAMGFAAVLRSPRCLEPGQVERGRGGTCNVACSVKCVGLGDTELRGLLVARQVAVGLELALPRSAFGWSARNHFMCICWKCSFRDNPTLLC